MSSLHPGGAGIGDIGKLAVGGTSIAEVSGRPLVTGGVDVFTGSDEEGTGASSVVSFSATRKSSSFDGATGSVGTTGETVGYGRC